MILIVPDPINVRPTSVNNLGKRPADRVIDPEVKAWPARSFVPESAPLYKGFPRKSKIEVKATAMVSTQGLYFDGDRLDPFAVEMGSDVRFIASESEWDDLTLKWSPYVSSQIDWFWEGVIGDEPILNDYQYQIGKEVFNQQVLSFDSAFLNSSFNDDADDAASYTVGMAIAPREQTIQLFSQTSSGLNIMLDRGRMVCSWRGQTRDLGYPYRAAINNFVFVLVSVDASAATFYIAWSPSKTFSLQIRDSNINVSDMIFTIGATGSEFDLAEWNLWARPLTKDEINEAVADLTSIYGE